MIPIVAIVESRDLCVLPHVRLHSSVTLVPKPGTFRSWLQAVDWPCPNICRMNTRALGSKDLRYAQLPIAGTTQRNYCAQSRGALEGESLR